MNYIFSKLTQHEMTRSGSYLHEHLAVFLCQIPVFDLLLFSEYFTLNGNRLQYPFSDGF